MLHKRIESFIKEPKKSLLKLSLPIVIGMFVQVMYNIVDTAFVGRLGAESIAALTFSFPVFFILIGLNAGLGIGMSSRISRFLGEGKKEDAENTAMHGIILSIIFSIVLTITGMIFIKPLFSMFGATETVLHLSISYMSILFYGMIFMFLSFIISSIFSAQGDTKTPTKIQIFGLVTNIILDPIFIYTFNLGVKGAAIATVISIFLSLMLSVYYLKKDSKLIIHPRSFKYSSKLLKEIMFIGIPASLIMLMMSLYVMIINRLMAYFGTDYVASFGLVSRLDSVAIMPIVALSMAIMVLVGMFYGAKRIDLVKEIVKYGTKIGIMFTLVIALLFFIFPSLSIRIFTADTNLILMGIPYLKLDILTFPFIVVTMIISRAMQGMGNGMPGFVVNLIRSLIIAVPLSYLFVFVLGYGYLSVAVAALIGNIAAAIVSIIWFLYEIGKAEEKRTRTKYNKLI